MLFILEYIYSFFVSIKEKYYYYYSNKDDLISTRKEQEFVDFNFYSKNIIIDNIHNIHNIHNIDNIDNLNTNLI